GERDRVPVQLTGMLARLRSLTDLPLCVGFGVSKPEHVTELRTIADGVIVGTALVRKLEAAGDPAKRESALADLRSTASALAAALNPVP
ncbi:MAG: tryptophan synthase subunit alpha, partial [Planctomycetia bacterium]|nr:tryptophan synthase subunit alpha [Planctomycetia bacterium]